MPCRGKRSRWRSDNERALCRVELVTIGLGKAPNPSFEEGKGGCRSEKESLVSYSLTPPGRQFRASSAVVAPLKGGMRNTPLPPLKGEIHLLSTDTKTAAGACVARCQPRRGESISATYKIKADSALFFSLAQLHQNAEGGLGVQEGYFGSTGASAGRLVD